ncbi:MAG: hypothetical protein ACJ8ER_06490 [Allosphingosinicella sp.]
MTPLALLAAAAAALLLALGLKLRGPRGGADLTGPSKRRRKRLTVRDARKITALVSEGKGGEARRFIREAGYDDSDAGKMVAFIETMEKLDKPAPTAAQPGWSETVRGEDGLAYGRGLSFDETLHEEDMRGKLGELGTSGE